jgi:hypothetical protein
VFRLMSFIKFGKFFIISSYVLFTTFSSLPTFWNSYYMMLAHLMVCEILFVFLYSIFLLYLRLKNLNWSNSKFSGSYFCWLKSFEPLSRNFYLVIVFFNSESFFLNNFYHFIGILCSVRYHSLAFLWFFRKIFH